MVHGLFRGQAQLGAELGEHFLMVTGDVVLRCAGSGIRRRTENIPVQSTTNDDAHDERRGDREERAGRIVEADHCEASEIGMAKSVAIVGATADVTNGVANGSVGANP